MITSTQDLRDLLTRSSAIKVISSSTSVPNFDKMNNK